MLGHLVHEAYGIDHVALALVVLDDDNVGTPVGVARMIRYTDQPTEADVAVTVLDSWQGRGAATALLAALVRERPVVMTSIVTTVAADNAASLAMLRRLGETVTTPAGINRLDVVVDLTPTDPPSAASCARRPRTIPMNVCTAGRRLDEPGQPDWSPAGRQGRGDVLAMVSGPPTSVRRGRRCRRRRSRRTRARWPGPVLVAGEVLVVTSSSRVSCSRRSSPRRSSS